MKLTKNHYILLVILITEVLGWSLILPFLPFYAQTFGASNFQVGLLLASFSLFQFISAPILGGLSDQYGRRPLLLFSQLTTTISFILLGFATSLPWLFMSRIVDGLLGSNGTIVQAYLSDLSSKKERSKAFGLSGVAFGIGFMIGPALGGLLSQISYSIPAFLAAGLSLLSLVLTYIFLPETVDRSNSNKVKIKIIDLKTVTNYLQDKNIRNQLLEFGAYILAQILISSNFAIFADAKYDLNASDVGWILTYIGAMSIALRGFLIPKLIDWLGESVLEKIGMMSMIAGLLILGLSSSYSWLLPSISLFGFGTGILRPLMMGDISRSRPEKEQGKILGVSNSITSLAQIVGPLLGGLLLAKTQPFYLIMTSTTILIGGFILILREKKAY